MLSIFLSIATFWIYYLYWLASLTKEVSQEVGNKSQINGWGLAILNIITGGIMGTYWFYKVPVKLNELREQAGLKAQSVSKSVWIFSILVDAQILAGISLISMMGDKDVREFFGAVNWDSEEGVAGAIIYFLGMAAVAWIVVMLIASVPILFAIFSLDTKPQTNYALTMFFFGILSTAFLQANFNNYLLYKSRKEKGHFATAEEEIFYEP